MVGVILLWESSLKIKFQYVISENEAFVTFKFFLSFFETIVVIKLCSYQFIYYTVKNVFI